MENINDTKKVIIKYVTNLAIINKEMINESTNLFEEGILDSLGIVALINFIESHYNIEISDEDFEMDHFKSVDTISELLHEKHF